MDVVQRVRFLPMNMATINWRKAATEFVVIVLGVLAALAMDQWRDDRKDRATEADYLIRLHADLSTDIQTFTSLELIFETKASIIKDLRDQSLPALLSRDQDSLVQDLVFSGFTSLPASQASTFDELLSTGRLALIQDVALRDALSRYYTDFEFISQILFGGSHGNYLRLLQESLPGELFYQWRLSNSLDNPEDLHNGLEVLLSEPGLAAAANAEITYSAALIYYLRQYRGQAEELLELLNE